MTVKPYAFTLIATLTLAACGGGGGGSSRPNSQASVTPQNNAVQPAKPKEEHAAAPQGNAVQPAKPKKEPAAAPQDNAVQPAKPNDRDTFSRLGLYNVQQGLSGTDVLKLVLPENGKNIELTLLYPDRDSFAGQPFVETLRDASGSLVGYLAHANVNQVSEDDYGEKRAVLRNHYFQYADSERAMRPAGDADIRYSGKMHYRYLNSGNLAENLTASVDATYHGSDKTVSMELISDSHSANRWYLYNQAQKYQDGKLRSERVPVGENGSVAGHLLYDENGTKDKLIYNGTFSGGFYGENGSVLTGTAGNESRHGEKWEGVIGATAE